MISTRTRPSWPLTILLVVCSLSVLIPLYLTIVTAFKTQSDMAGNLWALPSTWHWGNIPEAIRTTGFWRALGNSLVVTVPAVLITILTNSMVGYVIARNMDRKLFKGAYLYIMSGMFIPFAIMMLPIVKFMSTLGLDNLGGLVILYVVYNLPLNMLIYTGYVQSIPVELEEAAAMDGASQWWTYWRVIFPLMGPVNVTVGILTALAVWNDFLLPLVLLSEPKSFTLPLTQFVFQSQFNTNYNLAFSSYLIAVLPMVVVYLIFQKQIIGGVMRGSIK